MKNELAVVEYPDTVNLGLREARCTDLIDVFRIRPALNLRTNNVGMLQHRLNLAKTICKLTNNFLGIGAWSKTDLVLSLMSIRYHDFYHLLYSV